MLLLTIVCEGRDAWFRRGAEWRRALRLSTDSMHAIFDYFVTLAGPNPEAQRALLERGFALPGLPS